MKRISALMLCACMAATLAGCVVEPSRPAPPPHAYWVPGHYGPYGGWQPGHWQ